MNQSHQWSFFQKTKLKIKSFPDTESKVIFNMIQANTQDFVIIQLLGYCLAMPPTGSHLR